MHEPCTGGVTMRMAIIGFAAGAAYLQTQATLPAASIIAWAAGLLSVWLAFWQVALKRGLPVDGTPSRSNGGEYRYSRQDVTEYLVANNVAAAPQRN